MQPDMLELAQKQSEVYSVFGNASRVLVLWALGKRELSVSDTVAFQKSWDGLTAGKSRNAPVMPALFDPDLFWI